MATELIAETSAPLMQLNAEYWYRVDHPDGADVASLYAPDGKMVFGEFCLNGREEIDHFFQKRNSHRPIRTTRHASTNLYLEALNAHTTRVRSIVTVYADTGALPLETGVPTAVLDFDDLCILSSGRWLYQQRAGTTIFIGPGAAPFLTDHLPLGHPLKTEAAP